jgi:hypothetical protein
VSGQQTKRLGLFYGGSILEHRVIEDSRFWPFFAKQIYAPDLTAESLADLDGLYVPEGSNHRRLQEGSGIIRDFLERGGTVLVFGDHPVGWLPGLNWEWRYAASRPRLTAGSPDYGFHEAVPLIDEIWHHHGVLHPPSGVDTLLSAEDGSSVLYVDRVSTAGTVLATTLDPIQHCHRPESPMAARFLGMFLPWVVNDLL